MRFPAISSVALVAVVASTPMLRAEERKVSFNRDIRPIMSDTCFHCHGFDPKTREAGLRLDLREAAISPTEDDVIGIVPGKPDDSEIIHRIFDDEDPMPPDKAHKPLTAAQKDLFRRWVEEGAVYEPHWAYAPLVRPEVPAEELNAIDAFVKAKLAERKIEPSPVASEATLLRRLSLDLTGLPPSSAELASFLKGDSPQAYEKRVDRLLASPHFGERMAVWWLDVARFADTVGFHGDQNQRVFPYRDYVIDAFNRNKRFDQFTIEQLAGDLLPDPTPEQLVATGYNRLNMMTREGGAQAKEYLSKYGAERVRSVAAAWFGSTFGCAECHDHKFDPIKTSDFYQLQAFFADVKQWGVYSSYDYAPVPELAGVNNNSPFPPEIRIESPYLQKRNKAAESDLVAHLEAAHQWRRDDAGASTAFSKWRADMLGMLKNHPDGWRNPPLTATHFKDGKPVPQGELQVGEDTVVPYKRPTDNGETLKLILTPGAGSIASLQILAEPGWRTPLKRTWSLEGIDLKIAASVDHAKGGSSPLPVHFADATGKKPLHDNGEEILGIAQGWKLPAGDSAEAPAGVWLLDRPVTLAEGDKLVLILTGETAFPLRVSVSPFGAIDPLDVASGPTRAALLTDAVPTAEQERLLTEAWLMSTAHDPGRFTKARELAVALRATRDGRAWSLVTRATEPLTVRVLPRGNWQDESGPVVLPATPSFLPGRLESTPEKRLTRLDLANWLVSDANPITSRAVMNRLWQQFFGTGLSAAVDDLGSQGELPSHPELLDWLADEFRRSGWDVKHMIRLIVTSTTYRQHSSLRQELKDIDPANRLLASQNPRRLDAEFIRDNALFIAGRLNLDDIGGPSVKPYQPQGYYAGLQFPGREYRADTDDRRWRRGLYMHWQRTFMHPMLANFDAPARDECAALRTSSNTPQQALTLLNDPTFVEAARVFAARLLEEAPADDERLKLAYRHALAREPKEKEATAQLAFLESQRAFYRGAPAEAAKLLKVGIAPQPAGDPVELAAWASLCRVILNSHESLTRY